MIQIDKNHCSGCRACQQICPKQAISMERTKEGFLLPKIRRDTCVDCGLCEKVCPLLRGELQPPASEAKLFYHEDEQYRLAASSSGAFEAICRAWVQESPFTIFGCAMQEGGTAAGHIAASSWQQLQPMKKSKYVHSDSADSFRQVRQRLLAGDRVVFSGTPCQVMGLKNFLGKPYDNLLTVDFVCHGTPSPLALRQYVRGLEKQLGKKITDFSFRDKQFSPQKGWSSLGVRVTCQDGTVCRIPWEESAYMVWFLQGALSMECCYNCRFASCQRAADVTMGDFWGVEQVCPELAEAKTDGVSLLLLNSHKGRSLEPILSWLPQVRWQSYPLAAATSHNHQLTKPASRHRWRDSFYPCLQNRDFEAAVIRLTYGNPLQRAMRKLKRILEE